MFSLRNITEILGDDKRRQVCNFFPRREQQSTNYAQCEANKQKIPHIKPLLFLMNSRKKMRMRVYLK